MQSLQNKTLIVMVWLTIGSIAGCTTYLEEETPPGTVPPPPVTVPPAEEQSRRDIPPAEYDSKLSAQRADVVAATETIERFSQLYVARGRPRVAVFTNRELSGDVREWEATRRAVVARGGKTTARSSGVGGRTKHETEYESAIAASVEDRTSDGERTLNVSEDWKWAFEDGFIRPLLHGKVIVVDRSTIMRLVAAKAESGVLQPVARKQVEIEALKDHADIFVEVLISRSPDSEDGYVFRATAKEVATGTILANVSSLAWPRGTYTGRTVVATADGYQFSNTLGQTDVGHVASLLSIDLMGGLMQVWRD